LQRSTQEATTPHARAPRWPLVPRAHRILVVDDNRDIAASLALFLELHTASVAHSGREALSRIEQFVPEVALLDVGMPGMDGYQLAQRLRSMARFARGRVSLRTHESHDPFRLAARARGLGARVPGGSCAGPRCRPCDTTRIADDHRRAIGLQAHGPL
jgi:CheY-like chemotaxis protein